MDRTSWLQCRSEFAEGKGIMAMTGWKWNGLGSVINDAATSRSMTCNCRQQSYSRNKKVMTVRRFAIVTIDHTGETVTARAGRGPRRLMALSCGRSPMAPSGMADVDQGVLPWRL